MNLRGLLAILITGAAVVAGAAAGEAPAFAQDAGLKLAQSAFDEAQVNYLQGKFDEAAEGFKKAYEARPFSQFLYNIGASYHMKGKRGTDVEAYKKAVEYYKRYLSEDPKALDKAKVEKSVTVIEAEIQRLTTAAPPPAGTDPTQPAPPAAAGPSKEIEQLGDVKVRGLVVIESEPQNANIYLDGKTKGTFAATPWSGSLEGEHIILIEKRGYKSSEKRTAPDPSKLMVLTFVLAEEDYLGWLEIKSNVPGADIYLDDKSVGAIGKTPFSGNFKPGKHTVWVSTEGYDEFTQSIEIIAGETHEINASLKGSPVGYLNLRGVGIENSSIRVDGELLCERGPCRKAVKEGVHTVTVSRPDYKPYTRRIEVQAKTETAMKVNLARKPSRADAWIAGVLAVGFAGGGLYCGRESRNLERELRAEIDAGNPPPAADDPRFLRGKIFAIAADGAFVLAGVTALTAIYYTFRDKGAPSTAVIDVQALALQPALGPDYAGLGMEVRW